MCHNFTQLWKGARDMEIQEKPEKCSGGGAISSPPQGGRCQGGSLQGSWGAGQVQLCKWDHKGGGWRGPWKAVAPSELCHCEFATKDAGGG